MYFGPFMNKGYLSRPINIRILLVLGPFTSKGSFARDPWVLRGLALSQLSGHRSDCPFFEEVSGCATSCRSALAIFQTNVFFAFGAAP